MKKNKQIIPQNSFTEFLLYTTPNGKVKVEIFLRNETVWLKKYSTKFYNLDAIISVGYRVNSTQATHFRIWATQVLKEYIIKGFAMNDERLKNPDNIFGKDYFEEQLARIRDIRSSERRLYQKITDI
jgi:hypothetical protein